MKKQIFFNGNRNPTDMKALKSLFLLSLIIYVITGNSEAQTNALTSGGDKRLALVIGNSKYINSAPLANPVNDARAIKDALQKVGFDVYEYENLNQSQIKQAIDNFGTKLKLYSIGLFFYAGHGIQSKGSNYLIPVDANIQSEQQIEYDCVQADRVLGLMEAAGSKINIVILDACRNNPFERSWSRALEGTGLAFMNAPTGSLIAYSTSPGRTASDGEGSNGLYTTALLDNIKTPNITILQMFQNVRRTVSDKSYKQQIPWESTSLTNDFFFVNPAVSRGPNEIKASWKRTETGYWLYLDNEEIGARLVSDWSGKDLLVYDPVKNITCLLRNFNESPVNQPLPAIVLDNSTNSFWRCDGDTYYLYVKGDQIAKKTTKSSYVENDLLVYDDETNTTYILRNFANNSDNKIRPAELLDNADYAFWRSRENSYFLYVKGEDIQKRTKNARIENTLIVYDTLTNITYLFKDWLLETTKLKLNPAQIVSYQDNVFWLKKTDSYWLILKGESITSRTTNKWSGEDLYVTDTVTNVTYVFPSFANASENQLRPAIKN
jgi:hypothetical protein